MLLYILTLLLLLHMGCSNAFVLLSPQPSSSSSLSSLPRFAQLNANSKFISRRNLSCGSKGDDDDDDLFDYFDPRLSPHEYPNGIQESKNNNNNNDDDDDDDDRLNPFGIMPGGGTNDRINVVSQQTQQPSSSTPTTASSLEEEDVFDPRISPHEYPNGIPDTIGRASSSSSTTLSSSSQSSYLSSLSFDTQSQPSLQQQQQQQQQESSLDVFDPRLSPHEYPNGTPDTIGRATITKTTSTTTTTTTKIGILLIDHGSKREKSNQHLESLAQVYQQQYQQSSSSSSSSSSFVKKKEEEEYEYIVKAAHMEIAHPDIESGMRMLIEEGVGKIICHPYFLSPGKHATQDIPKLVSKAISSIDMPHIPVVTTEPVGTRLDVMVNVINDLVEESLRGLEQKEGVSNGSIGGGGGGGGKQWELGGFFGDVKRMLEEEEEEGMN